ncbi:Cleavage polyadenylation factor subunit clp1 [Gnomoniopsis smithogilvyi]|uniref:Polynucleotide 5'-hydroxyl-kinase GRC3 n=1 Tax=Gnomoniopsis smithogilvyi TaxID=1191159 RepID=A0A9W9CT22_9PEZI|nr:Cleavage polyadenylation factor subunit clp1 [Gnomoniopsis smithogilvyi]
MSIPGLGKLPIKATAGPVNQVITLHEGWEWRFQVDHETTISVRVLSGHAEKDGTELALNKRYSLRGTRSKITSLLGCQLEIEGACERQSVAEIPADVNPATTSHLNLHFLLNNLRNDAKASRASTTGPRVMLVGPNGVGKTTLARTLTSYAVKMGSQPIVVNTDPREGMLSLPGTLTAACFATMLDIEAEGMNGWGTTPTSGPSTVPPKLPIVYQYGHQHATHDLQLYKELSSKLAGTVTGRLSEDSDTKASGLIIDTPGVTLTGKLGEKETEMLAHLVDEFSVNIVVVLGSDHIEAALKKRFLGEKTTLGEAIGVVGLDKSDGVVGNDEAWLVACQHVTIKDYFFGDSRTTLSPSTQVVDFDDVTIYRMPEPTDHPTEHRGLEKIDPSPALSHWTMPIMNAIVGDSPEAIRTASVQGFVYISDINKDRRKINMLIPESGRNSHKPLLLGAWPEPFINLIG